MGVAAVDMPRLFAHAHDFLECALCKCREILVHTSIDRCSNVSLRLLFADPKRTVALLNRRCAEYSRLTHFHDRFYCICDTVYMQICKYINILIPLVPHQAVVEASKIRNLSERLFVVKHGWPNKSTDGSKGA